MNELNKSFSGDLTLAIEMFTNTYSRPFFNQLISSQLDVDRLDFLNRDSFFTGVSEGTIGAERLIKLLDLVNDNVVVEEKGIYSIENFLNARRLMYWQVYLHKTGLAADRMLGKIIERARYLTNHNGLLPYQDSPIKDYLVKRLTHKDFQNSTPLLMEYGALDDHDIWAAIKQWKNAEDKILAYLCNSFINRNLFKIELSNEDQNSLSQDVISKLASETSLEETDLKFLYDHGQISNAAYIKTGLKIKLLRKNGEVINIEEATDLPNINAMSRIVSKNYICWANKVFL
jgi:HD superfamily phosphohydrolase